MMESGQEMRQRIEARLTELQLEHRDLDLVLHRLIEDPLHDEFLVQRMKKRKLLLKEQIALLARQLDPDIRA